MKQPTCSTLDHDIPRELRTRERERGQAAVLVVTVVAALLVVFSTGVASMGRHTIDRTRAQTAADAAALAALDGGAAAAADLAARHGAVVTSFAASGFEVTVTVRVGDTRATARATDEP